MFRWICWKEWGSSKERVVPKDGSFEISEERWKEFLGGPVWSAFVFELEGRRDFLTALLVKGNDAWPDEQIRGRIYELDFFENIPALLISSVRANRDNAQNTQSEKE